MGWYSDYYHVKDKLVVISGGSQGLGASLAKACSKHGASVYVVARTESKLIKVVDSCRELAVSPETQKFGYVSADLSDFKQCKKVFAEIYQKENKTPDMVMCAAGLAIPGLLVDATEEVLETSIDCIYKSCLYFSLAALQAMAKDPLNGTITKQSRRHITLFSSVVAFYSFIGYGSYGPLKAAIRSLADVLRQECIAYDIKVECVFPGNIGTEGFEIEEKTKPEITKIIEGPSDVMDPDACAELILKRLDMGYQMVHTDFIGWVLNGISLGASPRTSSILLTLVSLILTLFVPIWDMIVNFQIKSYFQKKAQIEPIDIKEKKEN